MAKLKPEIAEKFRSLGELFIDAAIENAKDALGRTPPDYSEYRIVAKGKTEQEVWEKQHAQNAVQQLNLVERLGRFISAVDDPKEISAEDEQRQNELKEFDTMMKGAFKEAGISEDDDTDGGDDE